MKKAPSKRMFEVLTLLANGKTDDEIGAILGLSSMTVKNVVAKARKKYGVHNRVSVVLVALAKGDLAVESVLAYWRPV